MKNFIQKVLETLLNRKSSSFESDDQSMEGQIDSLKGEQATSVYLIHKTKKNGQEVRLLSALSRGPVSTFDAINIGIIRPAAVIFALRNKGFAIETKMIPVISPHGDITKVASYKLDRKIWKY